MAWESHLLPGFPPVSSPGLHVCASDAYIRQFEAPNGLKIFKTRIATSFGLCTLIVPPSYLLASLSFLASLFTSFLASLQSLAPLPTCHLDGLLLHDWHFPWIAFLAGFVASLRIRSPSLPEGPSLPEKRRRRDRGVAGGAVGRGICDFPAPGDDGLPGTGRIPWSDS